MKYRELVYNHRNVGRVVCSRRARPAEWLDVGGGDQSATNRVKRTKRYKTRRASYVDLPHGEAWQAASTHLFALKRGELRRRWKSHWDNLTICLLSTIFRLSHREAISEEHAQREHTLSPTHWKGFLVALVNFKLFI